jgi:hypothetical protein
MERINKQLWKISNFDEGVHNIIESQIMYMKQVDIRISYSFHLI